MKASSAFRRMAIAVATLAAVTAVAGIGPASPAAATPVAPQYTGDMTFPPIENAEGPEEFSWRVNLAAGQVLESVDERSAEVYYADGHHPAFAIDAEFAHDANGAEVPTTLAVTAPDIVTLTVHHRAGKPAAGGAPFEYPVMAGPGWEQGFETVILTGPKDETELREERELKERESRERNEREAREREQREAGTTRVVHWTVESVENRHTFVAEGPWIGSCGAIDVQPRVREIPGRAVVRISVTTPILEPGEACPDILARATATITLKQRLGDVTLYDGSRSPPMRRALPWERRPPH